MTCSLNSKYSIAHNTTITQGVQGLASQRSAIPYNLGLVFFFVKCPSHNDATFTEKIFGCICYFIRIGCYFYL